MKAQETSEKFNKISLQSLKSQHVGRLLVYSKVLASSMALVNKVKYSHGFAVIPRELTGAVGRGSNQVIEKLVSSLSC